MNACMQVMLYDNTLPFDIFSDVKCIHSHFERSEENLDGLN